MYRIYTWKTTDDSQWVAVTLRELWFFSPRCWYFLQVPAQGMYLSLGSRLLLFGIEYGTSLFSPVECQQLLMDMSLYLCIQDASLCTWLIFTQYLFQDKLEYSTTLSESLWTLQLQHSRVVFSKTNVFCYISPACSDQKFEASVQLVGFVFGSLLYTTEPSNIQVNLPLFTLWFSSICCRG